MLRVAVLISGRGSNLRNLIIHQNGYQVSAILSNVASAPGLAFGAEFHIPTFAFDRASLGSVKLVKSAIREKLCELQPDLILLAGYMLIVEPELIDLFPGRILNIHPALLPKFPGLDTHARAIAAHESEHGCTVHVVAPVVDAGPIIAQAKVTVAPNDTPESLAARVLMQEHALYPWVVQQLAAGEISLMGGTPALSATARAEAVRLGFLTPVHRE